MDQHDLWQSKWNKRTKGLPETEFAKRSFSLIKDKNFKSLLELGCGDGKDSLFFAKKGLRITAVDFSEVAINHLEEKIKQENIKNITPLLMNLEKLELNETFDIVYANLSLHYFDDKTTIKIFDQLYELLNKGGFLFVKCKSIDDFKYGKGEKLGNDYYLFKGHKRHFFSKKYMEEKLKKFKIIKIRKTSSKHFNIGMGTSHALFIEAVATS